jgi:hypothetical protein
VINSPNWPHFICPNCRSVADLEADVEVGEWEDADAVEEASVEVETAALVDASRRQKSSTTEGTQVADQEQLNGSASVQNGSEVEESSDDLESNDRVNQISEALGEIVLDESPSPSDSIESQNPQISNNATVAPVDIIGRKPVPFSASTLLDRRSTRTPSPNGTSSSLDVAVNGNEGPMTPRNDVGPFVFDGSAGTSSDARMAAIATMNLNAATEIPQQAPAQH